MRPAGRLSLSRAVTIRSPLPVEEMQAVLERNVSAGPDSRGGSPGPAPPFLGKVGKDSFEIRRINLYRSTFLPRLKGRIVENAGATEMRITMTPHREVVLFVVLWFLFLFLVSFLILSLGEGLRRLLVVLPLALAAATWVLCALVFESDCRWAALAFKQILEKYEGPPAGN